MTAFIKEELSKFSDHKTTTDHGTTAVETTEDRGGILIWPLSLQRNCCKSDHETVGVTVQWIAAFDEALLESDHESTAPINCCIEPVQEAYGEI